MARSIARRPSGGWHRARDVLAAASAAGAAAVSSRRAAASGNTWASLSAARSVPAWRSALGARGSSSSTLSLNRSRGPLSPAASPFGLSALGFGLGAAALRSSRFKARGAALNMCRRALATDQAHARLVTDEVLKAASDPHAYRVLELENGLQVMLASDPTADSSAAAMSINAGTFQDPDERPGLAHFHEHMLFLGTEKYPGEDDYNRYLSEHGGNSNAFTMSENTCYYFKVASPYLEGALDRFAQFFVAPTFNPSCVEREMNAVDSESTNYSTDDGWRLMQVLKASADEKHPFSRFDVGNLDTLGANDLDVTRERLLEWNRTHYQGSAMRLVVVGKESLEELESTIVKQFGPVRGGSGQALKYSTKPWPESQLGRVTRCVPLKDARSISACWPLPPQSEQLFSKPELYMAHMLGHEGQGSLHDVLNQLGWVDSLSAGGSHAFSDEQLFAVNISLTPEGDAHRQEVLALLFEYVKLVVDAGPDEAVYHELKALQEISFAHKEDSPAPDDFAASAAMALFKYPAKEALRGPYALDEWRPEVVSQYLSSLTPERCLIFLTSDAFRADSEAADAAAKGWKRETWYKAPYQVEQLTAEQLAGWSDLLKNSLEGEPSGLQLPLPNRFVPQDFSLRSGPGAATGRDISKLPMEVTSPTPLINEPMLRLWHKTDKAFKTPREYVLAHVHTGAYEMGPETVLMMRLFCGVVADDLNAWAYDAATAGLGYSLDFSDNLAMSVGGFSDKLPELLEVVTKRLGEVLVAAEEAAAAQKAAGGSEGALGERGEELLEKLETQRQILLQDYKNFTREEPYSVGMYYSSQLMLRNTWHLQEYIEVLEKSPDLGMLVVAVRKALSEIQVEMLVHGNADAEEAKAIGRTICDALKHLGAGTTLPELRRKEVTKLPVGSTTIFEYDLAAQNPAQENCCTQNIYEVGPTNVDLHRDGCVSLLCHMASVSAYDRLRTKEQLGYIVQSSAWVESHVCGLQVLIQGSRMPPKEVDVRIEEWLASFGKELEEMPEEEFQNNVKAVISERTQRYSRLVQETTRHWSEIQPRRYNFERLAEATKALDKICREDVLALFREHLALGAPQRRKLSVRVLGTSAGENGRTDPHTSEGVVLRSLEDIRAFQPQTESYPSQPPAEMPQVSA
ncbi:unnamed protein product [Polarella glacialis]|uniref:Insulin-degrading enzyme n=1 Tax=Polarella glacialis TaxID=89957 RepID=A0A813IHI5_POLGL|nr:unnamed protein product [Polarella glacialis]